VAVATAVAAGMAAVVDTIKIIDIIITKQFENPFHINEKDFFCIRMMTSDNCYASLLIKCSLNPASINFS
jgi:hypothetical protein